VLTDDKRTYKSAGYKAGGVGIGLMNARSLCRLFGGDLQFESVYGDGSAFFATLCQTIVDAAPLVEGQSAEKSLLLYETSPEKAARLEKDCADLGIKVTTVADAALFEQKLLEDKADWTLFPLGIEHNTAEFLRNHNLKTLPVVVLDGSITGAASAFTELPYPPWIAPLARALSEAEGDGANHQPGRSWTAPSARILVVDDMVTSLKIAKGLLEPYKCEVDLCMKAKQAIDVIEQQDYDIVFMDHLMPEMDGVEATLRIRSLDLDYVHNMPIIALSGNAAAGMRELFLESGMNDFISKPVDVSHLDTIMEKWIPEEKRVGKPLRGLN
jgi:CheY-like chemotaxis protein